MLKRDKYLEKLILYKDTEFIKVITGVRRSGKSTLLLLFRNHLKSEGINNILFLNFEHPDTFKIQDYESLYEYIKSNVSKEEKVYFLFDEIQEVKEWQKLVNGLRIAYDCDIYITGSNATLLSGELATYLTGRYVEIKVLPFTFSEIIEFKELDTDKEIQLAFNEYLKFGGFPTIVKLDDDLLKQEVLRGIYNSVILKDVSLRSNIEDVDMLLRISLFLMDNIGNPISVNNVSNYIRNQGYTTSHERVDTYLKLLEEAFVFYKAQRYDIRGKERLKTLGKYYVVDLGLRNTMLR
ncbi:MAG TPA: ATP-binding protein, partial [Erysipelothrix sp.]|nr:ATP-binding protein [Erysipelothrix sp.]